MRISVLTIALVLLSIGSVLAENGTLRPAQLRCEAMTDPCGVDQARPRLSWACEAVDPRSRALRQTAYEVLVASSPTRLAAGKGDLWRNGKVMSSAMAVPYGGKPLSSRKRLFWRVRVYDQNNRPSAWSAPSEWTMGILRPEDWRGRWIASDLDLMPYQKELKAMPNEGPRSPGYCGRLWGLGGKVAELAKDVNEAPAVYMRKEFDAPKSIRRAVVYASGLGCFELHINGRFVGPNLLDPGLCDYAKRVPYVVRDVTKTLRRGRNAVGVLLGNGWFDPISPLFHGYYRAEFISPPQLKMDLEIEYTDGTRAIIATGCDWRFTTDGPIRYNCFVGGETYDARKEMPGWSASGFDDSAWKLAKPAAAPAGRMSAQLLYPVRAVAEIPVAKLEKVGEDKWRFTLKENAAGHPRLRLRAEAGRTITMDSLGASGHTFGRYQKDIYITKGGKEEVYEPSLTYHGFGAVEVTGLGYEPKAEDLVCVVTATDLPVVGGFSCSDERLNHLQRVFHRTVQNYIIHLPNDPVREKSAWTQDVWNQFVAESGFYDVGPTYRKWQRDLLDGQAPDGYEAPVVPGRFDGPDINGPWWGGAVLYTPWLYYQIYGDTSLLAESYEGMKKQFAYLERLCVNEEIRTEFGYNGPMGKDILWWGLGDWNSSENPRARVVFTSTAALAYFARILADTSSLLNRSGDQKYFERRARETRDTFNRTFLNAETGVYDVNGGQTAQALPLALGLVPDEAKAKVEARLVKAIEEAKNHIGCGFVGNPILLTTLSDIGRADLAWTVATQPDSPSWLAIVRDGTYMEDWAGGGAQMPSVGASIHTWFMQNLGGIRQDSGPRHLVLHPDIVGGLQWVKAWHKGPDGLVSSVWSVSDGMLKWKVTVPPNTIANIHVPTSDPDSVRESGLPAKQAKGLRFVAYKDGDAIFEAGSGSYEFEAQAAGALTTTSLVGYP